MHELELVLVLMVTVAVLAVVARRLDIPSPILYVLGGIAFGLVPGLPRIELNPEIVFVLFLPPLLYWQALNTSLRDLRRHARSVGLLSIGLVLATMGAVAAVAHAVIPDLPWSAALVLGAIVAPPDAVAAAAIAERLRLPRNVITVLEGESLLNDATALVAYRVAVLAVTAGTFSWGHAAGSFVWSAAGGALIGLIVGYLVAEVRKRINDPPVENTLSLLTGFAAYLPAEAVGVSGVLAAVVTGLYLSRPAPRITAGPTRVRARAIWEMVEFQLNGMVFVLIGLQLPYVLRELTGYSALQVLWYAAAVSAAAIALRLVWVMPGAYLPRWIDQRLGHDVRYPCWQELAIVGWAGMRGVVSLAAALALPLTTDTGAPFPARSLIIFLTFAFILATLVGQGLTLPTLIRRLGVSEPAGDGYEVSKARYKAAYAGLRRLDELASLDGAPTDVLDHLRQHYDDRLRRFGARFKTPDDHQHEDRAEAELRIQRELLRTERDMVIHLRDEGVIGDDAMRSVERDLDLEETRLLV